MCVSRARACYIGFTERHRDTSTVHVAPMALTEKSVKALEEKLRSDISAVNEIVPLISACESGGSRVRLAALQVCRSLFVHWANTGQLLVRCVDKSEAATSGAEAGAVDSGSGQDSAMDAFREWLRGKYKRFIATVCGVLQGTKTPPALQAPALETLLALAATEIRHARPGQGVHFAALDNAGGAFRELVGALVCSQAPVRP